MHMNLKLCIGAPWNFFNEEAIKCIHGWGPKHFKCARLIGFNIYRSIRKIISSHNFKAQAS
jgi:hypothetical protein